MLAMILDPAFKNKMPGCHPEDPDIDREYIRNLHPQIHNNVSYKKIERASDSSLYAVPLQSVAIGYPTSVTLPTELANDEGG
ncbi:hypothetical protein P7K49_001499, partial [Saguinus oedipus]